MPGGQLTCCCLLGTRAGGRTTACTSLRRPLGQSASEPRWAGRGPRRGPCTPPAGQGSPCLAQAVGFIPPPRCGLARIPHRASLRSMSLTRFFSYDSLISVLASEESPHLCTSTTVSGCLLCWPRQVQSQNHKVQWANRNSMMCFKKCLYGASRRCWERLRVGW